MCLLLVYLIPKYNSVFYNYCHFEIMFQEYVLFYVYVCVGVNVYAPFVQYPWMPEKGTGSLGTGVKDGGELPCETKPGSSAGAASAALSHLSSTLK